MAWDRDKARSEYAEKLRDPRWQRMRLKIMERDEFSCQRCYDSESTLNVHHRNYEYGKAPWDYPESWLVTLCEECHQSESEQRKGEEQTLLKLLRIQGYYASDINEIMDAFNMAGPLFPPVLSAVCWALRTEAPLVEIQRMYSEDLRRRREAVKEKE